MCQVDVYVTICDICRDEIRTEKEKSPSCRLARQRGGWGACRDVCVVVETSTPGFAELCHACLCEVLAIRQALINSAPEDGEVVV
ncbi:hypothetical protein HIM_06062 [Hirsutella minnesotensis 3608]|uniref:Uncharacterized protein n=1 Tax=Hirsutella minnesotensis 3608 TaxID=1043627 RepID=A0A0F7ZJJ3_9HYPO|nr:hypothetical protein HIM_06062 [Hirsutella minnesotensis 3608]